MKITHEGVQSAGIVLSLILATVGLILQCTPKPENLVIDPGEVVWVNEPMQMRLTAPLPMGNRTLIGPIYWRVTVNNRSDRAVSLKSAEALVRDNRRGLYYVSGAFLGVYLDDQQTNALPFTVPAYESRSLLVKGFLPGWVSQRAQAECLRPRIALRDFQRCAFRTGHDLFGNRLEIIEHQGEFVGASWPANPYHPEFLIRFRSGADRAFETTASLLPLPT
jgi:hypothetical protein